MRILVIGSGGREHSIVWKLSREKGIEHLFCVSGNAGIAQFAECINAELEDFETITKIVKNKKIDLTVVGPEKPLADGIVDYFQQKGLKIFGPNRRAAMLESSKIYSKMFMKKYGIPTADFKVFDSFNELEKFEDLDFTVVKADGLCAGKGVAVCRNLVQAKEIAYIYLVEKKHGRAGEKIVLEKVLTGEEASLMAFCDGETIIPMPPSRDHKRIFENDKGPNTGGMGAYAPAAVISPEIFKHAKTQVFDRLLYGLSEEKIDYRGVIYAGIMVSGGKINVLEFNVRFGDPETQAVVPLLESPLSRIITATVEKKLKYIRPQWSKKNCVCIVLASGGYPGQYRSGRKINGLDNFCKADSVMVFHAGTRRQNNTVLTNGGRVLGVTGVGKNLKTAIKKTYEAIKKINFDGMHYRKDIGVRGLKNRN
ncbi:MAG: phosphoribosylamine--glycine ligase [Elusimicrobiota bacterium]